MTFVLNSFLTVLVKKLVLKYWLSILKICSRFEKFDNDLGKIALALKESLTILLNCICYEKIVEDFSCNCICSEIFFIILKNSFIKSLKIFF